MISENCKILSQQALFSFFSPQKTSLAASPTTNSPKVNLVYEIIFHNLPWQCLNFFPEPHGHNSFRPVACQPLGICSGGVFAPSGIEEFD